MEVVVKAVRSLKASPPSPAASGQQQQQQKAQELQQATTQILQLREKSDKLLALSQSSYSLIVYLLMSFVAQAKLIQKTPSLPRLPAPAVLAQKLSFPPK